MGRRVAAGCGCGWSSSAGCCWSVMVGVLREEEMGVRAKVGMVVAD